MKTKTKTTLATWFKQKRTSLGLSQYDLATMTGVTRGTISNIENGYANPSAALVATLVDALY